MSCVMFVRLCAEFVKPCAEFVMSSIKFVKPRAEFVEANDLIPKHKKASVLPEALYLG